MKKIIFSLALLTFICFNIGVFASESGSIQTDCIIKKKLKTPNKKLPSFDFEYTNSEVEESFKKYAGKKTKKLIYKTIERDIERLKKKEKNIIMIYSFESKSDKGVSFWFWCDINLPEEKIVIIDIKV